MVTQATPQAGEQTKALARPEDKLRNLMRTDEVMTRFREILGELQASAYTSSVLIVVADTPSLQECTATSIISSALRAATLRLSCDKHTGHAYLVPFKDHGVPKATLIVGYKGLMQMALRTGRYRFINVGPVYEGESLVQNRISGFYEITGTKKSDRVIGYLGAFELRDGYAKAIYMTVEQIHAHARRFSKGYDRPDGFWRKDTVEMEKKTILRQLLTKWGYLDPHDILAMNAEEDVINVEAVPVPDDEQPKRTESEILGEMGYAAQPASPAPAPSTPPPPPVPANDENYTPPDFDTPAPAAEPAPKLWTNQVVSMQMAMSESSKNEGRYWDMDTNGLTERLNGIQRTLEKNHLEPEDREEKMLKRDVIRAILQYRAQNQTPAQEALL